MSGEGAPAGGWVRALAPAKVNPYLEVLGRRPDGYCELDTTLLAIDLCDEIAVRRDDSGGLRLALSGPMATPDVPSDEENLAWRAARAVLDLARERGSAGPEVGLELELAKRIPSQAGLGGGSSDAAAAALAAAEVLGLELSEDELDRLLARLGSDCVFFARAATTGFARCRGRGEIVEPLPSVEGWWIALLAPEVRSPTGAVYAALEFPLSPRRVAPNVPWNPLSSTEREVRADLYNRLEEAASKLEPRLGHWRHLLDRNLAPHFRLSGSGSCYFGVYRDEPRARRDLERLCEIARRGGLSLRGSWLVRPAGFGARLLSSR